MRRLIDPPDDDEPELDDDDVFASMGLPHGGSWHQREGEDVLSCREHDLRVGEH
jgi:hypothetical protein